MEPWLLRFVEQFPELRGAQSVPTQAKGFSGATLFRLRSEVGEFALKFRPEHLPEGHLRKIHALMERARLAGLTIVPQVLKDRRNNSVFYWQGKAFDVCSWQPGAADFWSRPSPARLMAACGALAQMHRCWESVDPSFGPCPGVERRLHSFQRWANLRCQAELVILGKREPDAIQPWTGPAGELAARWQGPAEEALKRWRAAGFQAHPCLCDIWHDHVLFQEDKVAGIIDYDSVKWDHGAVDLARLLGSLVEDDEDVREMGLAAYHEVRALTPQERELVTVLDRTGAVAALTHWLRWLGGEREITNRQAAGQRLAALVRRIGKWTSLLP